MPDPYTIFDLPPDSDDETIRRRYLSLVRTHTPERDPERFSAIREAYEILREPINRMQYRLFEAGKDDSIDAILKEAKARSSQRRVPVATLLSWGRDYT
jgi:curved DNA-binding protein CbpA